MPLPTLKQGVEKTRSGIESSIPALAAAVSAGSPAALLAGGLAGKGISGAIGAGADFLGIGKEKDPVLEEQKKTTKEVEQVKETGQGTQKGVFTEILGVLESIFGVLRGDKPTETSDQSAIVEKSTKAFKAEEEAQEKKKSGIEKVPSNDNKKDGSSFNLSALMGIGPLLVGLIGAVLAKVFNVDEIIGGLAGAFNLIKGNILKRLTRFFGVDGALGSVLRLFSKESAFGKMMLSYKAMLVDPVIKFFSTEGGMGKFFKLFTAEGAIGSKFVTIGERIKPLTNFFTAEGGMGKFFKIFTAEGVIGSIFVTLAEKIKPITTFFSAEGGMGTFFKLFSAEGAIGSIFMKLKPIIDGVKAFMAPLIEFFSTVFGPMFAEGGALSKLMGPLKKIFSKIFVPITFVLSIWDAVSGAIENMEGAGKTWFDGVTGFFGGLLKFFTFGLFDTKSIEKFTQPIRNIFNGEGSITDNLIALVKAPFEVVWDALKKLGNWINDFFQIDKMIVGLREGIPVWLGGLSKKGADAKRAKIDAKNAKKKADEAIEEKKKAELIPTKPAAVGKAINDNSKENAAAAIAPPVIAPNINQTDASSTNMNVQQGDTINAAPSAASSESSFARASSAGFAMGAGA